MLRETLKDLTCPRKKKGRPCAGALSLEAPEASSAEVTSGTLRCEKCRSLFPILAGVAVLVDDVHAYVVEHVKGISQMVPDSAIPREFQNDYLEAKSEVEIEHIEEDLEARRVTSLYVINHYLSGHDPSGAKSSDWYRPESGAGSPLIESLIREHWDRGPLALVSEWIAGASPKIGSVVELGCGVGGLYPRLRACAGATRVRYLGVDSSFSSVAIARHLALGVPMKLELLGPRDLLQGSVSQKLEIPAPPRANGDADFIVGDADSAPVTIGAWDCSVALNMIDMLEDPAALPRLQKALVKPGGTAIQSAPYVWHEVTAAKLRKSLPKKIRDSASAAAWLYENEGFKIEKSSENTPWLFFKHLRQLEIYSVHLFLARS